MISHIRTQIRVADLLYAASSANKAALPDVERRFAETFGFAEGILFPYARSGLFALLAAQNWHEREVVCPAYTCAVVPYAISASSNTVRFVDSAAEHFLPDVAAWTEAVSPQTAMAIVTPLFGYANDAEACVMKIRDRAPGAFVLFDEAQSFGAPFGNLPASRFADGAIVSLGLGKMMSALSGGVVLLRDRSLANDVRRYRDTAFREPPASRTLVLVAKGCAAMAAYGDPGMSILEFASRRIPAVAAAARSWDDAEQPGLPDDALLRATAFQASIGLRQLGRFEEIRRTRGRIGRYFEHRLIAEGLRLFEHDDEPTWPRFPLAVSARPATMSALAENGVRAGTFLSYSSADLPAYRNVANAFPNATRWGSAMINLPNWSSDERVAERVVRSLLTARTRDPAAVAWPA